MTEKQIEFSETQAFQAVISARRAENACRLRVAIQGQNLEALGRALQEYPEEVTGTPEPGSIYDFREGLNALDRASILAICNELRRLIQQSRAAEARIAMLKGNSVQNSDS